MNDNQKKMVLAINFINRLMDLVDKKAITFQKVQQLSRAVLDVTQETDFADKMKERMEEILKREKINILLDYQLEA